MSVVVSRSARIKSSISTGAALLLLVASVLQLGNFFALRGLRRSVEAVPSISTIEDVVLSTMDRWAASNKFVRAENVPRGTFNGDSSSSSDSGDPLSLSPRFVSVFDFATWLSPSGRMMARVQGVECGVGDYLPTGLVLSIRPGRVICQDDQGLLIIGRMHSAAPPSSTLGDGGVASEGTAPLG